MEQIEIIKNLEELPSKQFRFGLDYAKKKATFKAIDEQKKAYLASLEIDYSYGEEGITQTEVARLARGSKEYRQFLFGRAVAERAYLKAEATLNAINSRIDCVRSINSIKKSEHNII